MTEPADTQISEVITTKADNDWLLENIVQFLVNNGVSIGLTLTFGGTTISGMAISGEAFFGKLADSVKTAKGPSEPSFLNFLSEHFAAYKEVYQKPVDASEDYVGPKAAYIHLENAYIIAPGQIAMPGSPGMLWRGKISDVSGFSLGNISSGN